jgi:cell division protein FtsB
MKMKIKNWEYWKYRDKTLYVCEAFIIVAVCAWTWLAANAYNDIAATDATTDPIIQQLEAERDALKAEQERIIRENQARRMEEMINNKCRGVPLRSPNDKEIININK